jgi:hypothetical protein
MPDVADATRRAAVVWVEVAGRSHPVWHVWHADAMYVVSGGIEQPLPETTTAVVGVPVNGEIGLRWEADVSPVAAGTPLWDEVVPLLHAGRLNPPDGEAQPERWARESVVQRFVPRFVPR